MSVFKIIIFILLGLTLTSCGKIAEKVKQTDDGRIILSLKAEENDSLVIPEGPCKNCTISKTRLGKLIAENFTSISQVFDISMVEKDYRHWTWREDDGSFLTSFSVKTITGDTYTNIQCKTKIVDQVRFLRFFDCGSRKVQLDPRVTIIEFSKIVMDYSPRERIHRERILL